MTARQSAENGLREAAAWVAESIGYPTQVTMPDHPMPQPLWDALVDHIHADESGQWHGNTLDREDVEWWLADEAGRAIPPADEDDCACGHDHGVSTTRCDRCYWCQQETGPIPPAVGGTDE